MSFHAKTNMRVAGLKIQSTDKSINANDHNKQRRLDHEEKKRDVSPENVPKVLYLYSAFSTLRSSTAFMYHTTGGFPC